MVGLKIDAGCRRGSKRVAKDGVLDKKVFGGDDADALPMVVVADNIADDDIHVLAEILIRATEVDAVAARAGNGQALYNDIAAAEEGERMAPF